MTGKTFWRLPQFTTVTGIAIHQGVTFHPYRGMGEMPEFHQLGIPQLGSPTWWIRARGAVPPDLAGMICCSSFVMTVYKVPEPKAKSWKWWAVIFLIALFIHSRNGQIDDLGTGPWLLEHPENWLTGSIIESKRSFFGYYIILYYLYILYIYYIYIIYILYIYIIYITTFLAGGDHTYHITFPSRSVNQIPSPDRPRYPSSTSSIPNDRAFIEASVHRDLLSRGRGPPKNNTDTLR